MSVRALLAAVLITLPLGVAAELLATVEPRVVDEFDTLRLTIRATGNNQTERLDLSELESTFEVLTTQSASQYRSVNGRVESWVEYQIMLRPLTTGDLTIPPIQVSGDMTEPLAVHVRSMAPELRDAIDRMVFFETELTANPVYVQAQTVLVRRLYYASGAQIYSDLPGLPDIPDAIVTPLGETTSTTTIRDGQRYGVIEQRFAILPEQSGALPIPAIAVTSSVRLEVNGRTRRSGVRVATEPLTLEVLPIPPDYPSQHPWLPAESLVIEDAWDPAAPRMAVGDPIRRTVRARIQGNVSSAIPPLQPALPDAHFRRYPEPPELADDQGGSSVRGTREEAYAIIPTAPGTVQVEPVEVVWWDVNEHEVRTSRAPGRTLTITGTAVDQPVADVPAPDAAEQPEPPERVLPPVEEESWPGHARNRTVWLALLLAAAAGAVLAWLAQRQPWRRGPPPARVIERALRRNLARACRSGDPHAIHQALLGYLRACYQAPAGAALQQFRADGFGEVLDGLNAALYARDPSNRNSSEDGPAVPQGQNRSVVGRAVLDAAGELHRRRRRARHPAPLPALFD